MRLPKQAVKVVVSVASLLVGSAASAEEQAAETAAPAPAVESPAPAPEAAPTRQAAQAPAAEAKPAPAADAPKIPERSFEETQRLVGGAPLYNPNVRVHTVQKKRFADQGKAEITLYPAVAQVNGKFTQHFGSAVALTYHLHENFALQLTPQYNWYANESDFNRELIDKVRSEAQAASSLLLQWGAIGGVEVSPFYGKFSFLDTSLAQFSFVVNGGVGIGSTSHQLRPNTPLGRPTYGDTGNRFLGSIGAGLRVQFGDRFALRTEVRDVVYTAKVDQVNGCNESDLAAMNDARHRRPQRPGRQRRGERRLPGRAVRRALRFRGRAARVWAGEEPVLRRAQQRGLLRRGLLAVLRHLP